MSFDGGASMNMDDDNHTINIGSGYLNGGNTLSRDFFNFLEALIWRDMEAPVKHDGHGVTPDETG